MYSYAWKPRKIAPSATVAASQSTVLLLSPAFNAQCEIVSVTPEVNNNKVLIAGIPHAPIVWNSPPILFGPLVGHASVKPDHKVKCVDTSSPSSHGTDKTRA